MKTTVFEARKKTGISRCELVRLTGLSESHVMKIERNEIDPRIGTLAKIATALGIKVAELIAEEEVNEA